MLLLLLCGQGIVIFSFFSRNADYYQGYFYSSFGGECKLFCPLPWWLMWLFLTWFLFCSAGERLKAIATRCSKMGTLFSCGFIGTVLTRFTFCLFYFFLSPALYPVFLYLYKCDFFYIWLSFGLSISGGVAILLCDRWLCNSCISPPSPSCGYS